MPLIATIFNIFLHVHVPDECCKINNVKDNFRPLKHWIQRTLVHSDKRDGLSSGQGISRKLDVLSEVKMPHKGLHSLQGPKCSVSSILQFNMAFCETMVDNWYFNNTDLDTVTFKSNSWIKIFYGCLSTKYAKQSDSRSKWRSHFLQNFDPFFCDSPCIQYFPKLTYFSVLSWWFPFVIM